MRWLRTGSLLAAAALLLPAHLAGAVTVSDIAGEWTSVDAVDGSDQVMRITPSGRLLLVDSSATVCDGAAAVVSGRGVMTGDDFEATLRVVCVGGGVALAGAAATFTYDEAEDTLTDSLGGTVWSRG